MKGYDGDVVDISGINKNLNNQTIDNARNKIVQDDFEKRLKNVMESKDEKELKKVCKEFEGILLGMMYKEMKATVPKSDLIPDAAGKDIFESMLDDKLIEEAKNKGLGLAEVLYRQLCRQMKSAYKIDS